MEVGHNSYNSLGWYVSDGSGGNYLRDDMTTHPNMDAHGDGGGTYFKTSEEAQAAADRYNAGERGPVVEGDDETPTLWRDMTPAEKGALLLAHHEGKAIEWLARVQPENDWGEWSPCDDDCLWDGTSFGEGFAYRIAPPEPVVKTYTQERWVSMHETGRGAFSILFGWIDGAVKGTAKLTTVDGKPVNIVWEVDE